MKRAVRSAEMLYRLLKLPLPAFSEDIPTFPTFVPLEFLRRMIPGDPSDPLLRQVLPIDKEHLPQPGFVSDPVGDLDSLASAGLIHKYQARALVIATGACGVHCRYCFRREFPYSDAGSRRENWKPAIDYVANRPDVQEVILSGGDPLTLTDSNLLELISRMDAIAHVKRIRIHTRMPIVIPQRITESLVQELRNTRATTWVVVHTNHANELDHEVIARLAMLSDSGIPILNQAVLLSGVNDTEDALVELFTKLIDHRIIPYYLHQLDRVRGASHFEVSVDRGLQLMGKIRSRLPGYAVPTYVSERAGEKSKTPL